MRPLWFCCMAPLWFRELRSVLVTGKVGVAHAKSIGTPIFMGAITALLDFNINKTLGIDVQISKKMALE